MPLTLKSRACVCAILAVCHVLSAWLSPALGSSAPAAAAAQPRQASAGVRNFVLIANEARGWRQFAARATPVFKAGEAIQFYAEPVNFGWSPVGGRYRFEMRVDVEIRALDGQVLWGQRDYGHLTQESTEADPNTYITGAVRVKGLQPGAYMLTVRFRDPNNARVADIDVAFGILPEPRWIDA